jgi:hypothetical protein
VQPDELLGVDRLVDQLRQLGVGERGRDRLGTCSLRGDALTLELDATWFSSVWIADAGIWVPFTLAAGGSTLQALDPTTSAASAANPNNRFTVGAC